MIRHLPAILAALLAAGPLARAQAPFWPHPDHPCRLEFAQPEPPAPFLLLPFHHHDVGFVPESFRILGPPPARTPLAWRRLARSRDRTILLVQVEPAAAAGHLLAYAGPAGLPHPHENPALTVPAPILADSYPARGRGFPETWTEIRFFLQNAPRPARSSAIPGLPHEFPREGRPAILSLHTHVICPEPGPYAFRAAGALPLVGAVQGAPLDPLTLEGAIEGPDVAEIRLFTGVPDGRTSARLEWRPPGAAAFTPIPPAAFAGHALAEPRKVEWISRTLQPFFEADPQIPYGFRDLPAAFYPARFTDRSENWLPHSFTTEWRFPDGSVASNAAESFTFLAPGPHAVTLTIEDTLGFSATLTHQIAWPHAIPLLHTLSALPAPLPAAAFRADWLEPALITHGQWPAGLDLQAHAVLRLRDGRVATNRFPLAPSHFGLTTQLAKCRAGEFESLAWSVVHHGVALTNGLIRGLHPPFPAHQARLAGDRIEDEAGHQIVYIVPRLTPAIPPVTAAANGPIRILDDWLAHPAVPEAAAAFPALLAETIPDPATLHPLADWRAPANAWKPLLKLAEAPALAGPDPARLVLTLGGQDLDAGLAPDLFERQAAALSDRLAAAGHAVLWVTPPPFPDRPEKARQYAVVIRRVAESRRLPVADLYSRFAGADADTRSFFHESFPAALSALGRRLAADGVADRLRQPPPAGAKPAHDEP